MFVIPGVHVADAQVPRQVWVFDWEPVPVPQVGEQADQPLNEPQYPATPGTIEISVKSKMGT